LPGAHPYLLAQEERKAKAALASQLEAARGDASRAASALEGEVTKAAALRAEADNLKKQIADLQVGGGKGGWPKLMMPCMSCVCGSCIMDLAWEASPP
jgi:hypothetical protein